MFRLVTVTGEGTHPGVDLDRPRTLLVAKDEARYGASSDDTLRKSVNPSPIGTNDKSYS